MLHSLRWFDVGVYLASYAFNGGVVLQIFFLSLSVGSRLSMLIREKEQMKDYAKQELEIKVAERTKELREKNLQLDSLVYKASHDIKGPLKSIIGLTNIASSDIDNPAAQQYFEHILKSAKRLDTLLHDLLDLTKMQRELPLTITPVDLEQMLKDIYLSFSNMNEAKNFNFEIKNYGVENFQSDRNMLYSIFQNLIENSIKYQDPNKEYCNLKVGIKPAGKEIEIEFCDNGIGIAEEFKDRVFEMFSKANDNSSGFGLGLHIVKISVQKLKGKVELNSNLGKGSVFKIMLPVVLKAGN